MNNLRTLICSPHSKNNVVDDLMEANISLESLINSAQRKIKDFRSDRAMVLYTPGGYKFQQEFEAKARTFEKELARSEYSYMM